VNYSSFYAIVYAIIFTEFLLAKLELIIKQIWLIKPKTVFDILKFSFVEQVSKMSFVS
jgi:hypothetical protein